MNLIKTKTIVLSGGYMEKKPDPIKLHEEVKEYFEKIYKKYEDCEELTQEEKVIIVLTAQQKHVLELQRQILEDLIPKLQESLENDLNILERLNNREEYLEGIKEYFENVSVDKTLN